MTRTQEVDNKALQILLARLLGSIHIEKAMTEP